jgi:hypothetical protein
MPDQSSSDPQILSKVLRTKLGLPWEPRWDTAQLPPEAVTADQNLFRAGGGYAPLPQANMGTMQAARDLANPLVRQQLGLPPRIM